MASKYSIAYQFLQQLPEHVLDSCEHQDNPGHNPVSIPMTAVDSLCFAFCRLTSSWQSMKSLAQTMAKKPLGILCLLRMRLMR